MSVWVESDLAKCATLLLAIGTSRDWHGSVIDEPVGKSKFCLLLAELGDEREIVSQIVSLQICRRQIGDVPGNMDN